MSDRIDETAVERDRRPDNSPYSPACWARFVAPRHLGPPSDSDAVVRGEARGRADDSEIRFWLARVGREAWFQAHGSPWAVAAAELLCERHCAGRPIPDAHELREALAAPVDRLDTFFTVEDAWRQATGTIDDSASEVN